MERPVDIDSPEVVVNLAIESNGGSNGSMPEENGAEGFGGDGSISANGSMPVGEEDGTHEGSGGNGLISSNGFTAVHQEDGGQADFGGDDSISSSGSLHEQIGGQVDLNGYASTSYNAQPYTYQNEISGQEHIIDYGLYSTEDGDYVDYSEGIDVQPRFGLGYIPPEENVEHPGGDSARGGDDEEKDDDDPTPTDPASAVNDGASS